MWIFCSSGDALALRDELLTYAELDCLQRQEIGLRGREWLLQNRSYPDLPLITNIIYEVLLQEAALTYFLLSVFLILCLLCWL